MSGAPVRVRPGAVRAVLLLTLPFLAAVAPARGQALVEWTEAPGTLGLGYPVPIPVDTPLPFDGFRSYAGLRARHEQLALDTGLLEGAVVGETIRGREIVAWRLGDRDARTVEGLPEPAVMVIGGLHAREWQSPEVVTGIMERLLARRDERFLEAYLLDNVNAVVVPVVNVDGFLQTQRYPRRNYLGADPTARNSWPRDGRMTRKNLRGRDEDLFTVADHLAGVDLNRNNEPFWASSQSSSTNPASLVHHGAGPVSEPETEALVAAVALAPADRLRVYTDVHSFGRVFFSEHTANARLNDISVKLLAVMANHHAALPGGVRYLDVPNASAGGIGSTDEYFSRTFSVPSWTLEIEPADGGVEYGGLGSNGHDGFILPEAEIRRVRENLAESFAVAWYHQAGPPSVAALRVTDVETGAAVFDAEWDVLDAATRARHETRHRPLVPGRSYELWIAFDKPMRWREAGAVVPLPGQPTSGLNGIVDLRIGNSSVLATAEAPAWLAAPGGAPAGHRRYRDDALRQRFTVAAPEATGAEARFLLQFSDLVGLRTDADPATVADWGPGHWVRYERTDGTPGDVGGMDRTIAVPLAGEAEPPFVVAPGTTAAWYDPERAGEGFLVEILADDVAVVYWFTYDEAGEQRWFTGTGAVRGNELVFEELFGARGGRFGEAFDPAAVELVPAGRLSLLFTACDSAAVRFDAGGVRLRQQVVRLTAVAGPACADGGAAAASPLTGSWYDPARAGEGFVVQALADGRALVYWFTWTPDGEQAWFFGEGPVGPGGAVSIAPAFATAGARFGAAFDPDDVVLAPWGELAFDFDCETGAVGFAAREPAYGSGSFTLRKLTRPLAARGCD